MQKYHFIKYYRDLKNQYFCAVTFLIHQRTIAYRIIGIQFLKIFLCYFSKMGKTVFDLNKEEFFFGSVSFHFYCSFKKNPKNTYCTVLYCIYLCTCKTFSKSLHPTLEDCLKDSPKETPGGHPRRQQCWEFNPRFYDRSNHFLWSKIDESKS